MSDPENKGPAVVALGGGHGLSVTLRSLLHFSERITGIVGTADDGGSSGRLRQHLHIPPPGDLRMAIAALMPDDEQGSQWRSVLQHRFDGSVDVGGHALGNLLLAALWEESQDIVAGLSILNQAMRTRGRVLPNCLSVTDLVAHVRVLGETIEIRGQAEISQMKGFIEALTLDPPDPPACEQAMAAIEQADLIVFGPGSWFTSILSHLLVPSIREALSASAAHRVVVVNLADEPGETEGYPSHEYLSAWARLFPEVSIDTVLADSQHIEDLSELGRQAQRLGARVETATIADGSSHHPQLLGQALQALVPVPRSVDLP